MNNRDELTLRYRARLESIQTSLARLTQAAGQSFGTRPAHANWCDLTHITETDEALKDLCDKVFQEGEYEN